MLNKCPVIYNDIAHTYFLDGVQLDGITTLLHRQMFKDMYEGASKSRLEARKQYGSLVHQQIELYDSLGINPTNEVVYAYQRLKDKHSFVTLANEYLVSDCDWVASSIDIVFEDYSLADIKTTSSLNKEYVSWQLSIYAYLFELQNPGLKVPRLYAIWMPEGKRAKVVDIERKPTEWCKELIACDKRGEQYQVPTPSIEFNDLVITQDVIAQVVEIKTNLKRWQQLDKELNQGLLEQMKARNIKSFKCDTLQLTYKGPIVKESIDTKMLQEKYPEIYEECLKETIVKESIMIKV